MNLGWMVIFVIFVIGIIFSALAVVLGVYFFTMLTRSIDRASREKKLESENQVLRDEVDRLKRENGA